MLLDQEVNVTWTGNNRKHYEEKGYVFTNYKESFLCKAKDLSPSSEYYVKLKCDYCGEEYSIMYKKYILHNKIVNKDACTNCKGKKNVDVKIAKYGTASPTVSNDWRKSHENKMNKKHIQLWKEVKQICKDKDYKLISDKFISNTADIEYVCNKHKEFGIQTICWNHLSSGEGCKFCAYEHRNEIISGENHWNWQGGISTLNEYLRNSIMEWKKDSFFNAKFLCDITGTNRNNIIHHKYSFNLIVKETLKQTNLDVHKNVNDYTQKELDLLSKTCLELHYKYGLGVCLNNKLHKRFHKLYGNRNNTPEQYEEFKYKYQNGLL